MKDRLISIFSRTAGAGVLMGSGFMSISAARNNDIPVVPTSYNVSMIAEHFLIIKTNDPRTIPDGIRALEEKNCEIKNMIGLQAGVDMTIGGSKENGFLVEVNDTNCINNVR